MPLEIEKSDGTVIQVHEPYLPYVEVIIDDDFDEDGYRWSDQRYIGPPKIQVTIYELVNDHLGLRYKYRNTYTK